MSEVRAKIPTKRRMSPLTWAVRLGWKHLVGFVMILFSTFPILYIISTSLSDSGSVDSGVLFSQFYLGNYQELVQIDENHHFLEWAWNTIFIASVTSVLSVFISALAAFAFSRLRFRGRRAGLLTLILIQMFPSMLGLSAIFSILAEIKNYFPALGLYSVWGLILVYLGGSLGGGTYLMYGFFNTVPKEIDEAAKIDGATHTQIFFRIILRLVAPVLAVQMLLSFIGLSSDYILASIALDQNPSKGMTTLAVGLQSLIDQPYSKNWAMFCSGAVLAATPIVILFMALQRYITSGLTGGAVKG